MAKASMSAFPTKAKPVVKAERAKVRKDFGCGLERGLEQSRRDSWM